MLKLCTVLDLLYKSNKRFRRLSYKEFYNETANNDHEYKKVIDVILIFILVFIPMIFL